MENCLKSGNNILYLTLPKIIFYIQWFVFAFKIIVYTNILFEEWREEDHLSPLLSEHKDRTRLNYLYNYLKGWPPPWYLLRIQCVYPFYNYSTLIIFYYDLRHLKNVVNTIIPFHILWLLKNQYLIIFKKYKSK